MFNGDHLNDEYENHRRRFAHITKDELEILVADARIVRPRWYNSILAKIGDGLIAAGSSIKEHNAEVKPQNFSVFTR
jgi:hypothetical protein